MSNQELLNLYISTLAELSIETQNTRNYILHTFIKAFEEKSILDLQSSDIRNYIIRKKEQKEWNTPNTISGCLVTIKIFYKFLISEKYLSEEKNPTKNVKTPRKSSDFAVRSLNVEELRRLIKAADAQVVSLKNRLIFYLAFTTGMRATEITNVKKENIDLTNRLIFLPKEAVKGKYRAKLVPFSEKTKELIEFYLLKYPNKTAFLFESIRGDKQIRRLDVYSALKLIICLAYPHKGTWSKPYGSHIARHTFATRWIETGGDVHALRAVMGWQSFAQLDRYVNVSADYIRKASIKVERKLLKV